MLDKAKSLAGSRRFWAGLVTSIAIYLNQQLNILPGDQMLALAGIVSAWILGESMRSTNG